MYCEICAQYERQLRSIQLEINETRTLLEVAELDVIQHVLLTKDAVKLKKQLDAAQIAESIHRRRWKCAQAAVA